MFLEEKRRIRFLNGTGVGKSSLLRMFRIICKQHGVPVALASGEQSNSPADVLYSFAKDLGQDGLQLRAFSQALEHYHKIQTQIEQETKKTGSKSGKIAGTMGKAVIEVALSAIPVVGPLASALGGAGADVFVDWLGGFLSKDDLEFYLDPVQRLTAEFISNINQVAKKHRLVLMLDTYEQMPDMNEWTRELAQKLHTDILLVIAGRAALGAEWDRAWQGWRTLAHLEELKVISEEDMRRLVQKYYSTMRGDDLASAQIKDIADFARGLPLAVTATVQLWTQYGIEDFNAVKPQVIADMVDRIMEGIPETMRPVLQTAATLRWFNKDILRALLPTETVDEFYDDLRRFPFVRPRVEGLAIHDLVREMLDENFKVHDPTLYTAVHKKAVKFFEKQLQLTTDDKRDDLILELLYHGMIIDEDEGTRLLCQICEELVQAQLVNRLRVMLSDAQRFPLAHKQNKLWRDYYAAWVLMLESQLAKAEALYERLAQNQDASPRLKAYALCDLGWIIGRYSRLGQVGSPAKAIETLEKSLNTASVDTKLVESYYTLAHVYSFLGEWDKAELNIERARHYFKDTKDDYGIVNSYAEPKHVYGFQGDLKGFFSAEDEIVEILSRLPEFPFMRTKMGWWPAMWTNAGRFTIIEQHTKAAYDIIQKSGAVETMFFSSVDLSWPLIVHGKFAEAEAHLKDAIEITYQVDDRHSRKQRAIPFELMGELLIRQERFEEAEVYLSQSLTIREELGDYPGIPGVLTG